MLGRGGGCYAALFLFFFQLCFPTSKELGKVRGGGVARGDLVKAKAKGLRFGMGSKKQ